MKRELKEALKKKYGIDFRSAFGKNLIDIFDNNGSEIIIDEYNNPYTRTFLKDDVGLIWNDDMGYYMGDILIGDSYCPNNDAIKKIKEFENKLLNN